MPVVEETYDIVVVGAGHAGCEAALAAARLGFETIMFTVSVDSIALMPCNPNVGGSSKGHLVRELDALGGEMGKNIDKTFIQSKMLNESKGPAVHSLRAQADKQEYTRSMRRVLENTDHLTIRQAEIAEILTEEIPGEYGTFKREHEGQQESSYPVKKRIVGVKTYSGAVYRCREVVLATGVYLRARCIYGDVSNPTGPNGLQAANHLTDSLKANGIEMYRFKTGTPARADKRSIDFSKMEEQFGDKRVVPFSFSTDPESIQKEQISCWLTYTNEKTHEIIRNNLERSPLFSGAIEGTGPRYCPSIEDKVVRFKEKERHPVFVEPCGEDTEEMYLQGLSSSLPEAVQNEMYRTIRGFEHLEIMRPAYAIEYDCVDPTTLKPTLESKVVGGIYGAGQFNGTSGYEEAAAQGLLVGLNAARHALGRDELVLARHTSYLGTLVDDLVTKGVLDPYRMMTSRSEYRLSLRQDNADERLTPIGREYGLVDDARWAVFCRDREVKQAELKRLETTSIKLADLRAAAPEGAELGEIGGTAMELMRRPYINYDLVSKVIGRGEGVTPAMAQRIETEIRYAGYIAREERIIRDIQRHESVVIPENFDYAPIETMTLESREKLAKIRPRTLAQAGRIPGVSPSDLAQLSIVILKDRK